MLIDLFDDMKEEHEMPRFSTIKYVDGRKVYVTEDGDELTVKTAKEIFEMFKERRLKGLGDTAVFNALSKRMTDLDPKSFQFKYWKEVFELTERVYEKYQDQLPELQAKQETPPPKSTPLFQRKA